MSSKLRKNRKGQAAVEYAVLLVAILIVSIAAISVIGHKTADLFGLAAVVLPGSHDEDNGPIFSGQLIETTPADVALPIVVDLDAILAATGDNRIDNNVTGNAWGNDGNITPGTMELLIVDRLDVP